MEKNERSGADTMSRIEGRTSGVGSVDYNHESATSRRNESRTGVQSCCRNAPYDTMTLWR